MYLSVWLIDCANSVVQDATIGSKKVTVLALVPVSARRNEFGIHKSFSRSSLRRCLGVNEEMLKPAACF